MNIDNKDNRTVVLIQSAVVYAPQELGRQDVLVVGETIQRIAPVIDADAVRAIWPDACLVDASGLVLTPGFIDCHSHVLGGGGEAGFRTRVPPPPLSSYTSAGVTTLVGLLGTDDLTKSTSGLLAQVYALQEEGLSAYAYTGGYHIDPATTLTGNVKSDIVHVPAIIGFGELAISDHRSSHITAPEFIRLAKEVHVASLMAGKNATLHLHLGTEASKLDLVSHALQHTDLPARLFHPTHSNRNQDLFDQALHLRREHPGLTVDVTPWPEPLDSAHGLQAADCVMQAIRDDLRRQCPEDSVGDHITVSSDCGGSIHTFDPVTKVASGFDYGRSSSLFATLCELSKHHPLHLSLKPFTTNPARVLGLKDKGRIAVGCHADLLLVQQGRGGDVLSLHSVLARGVFHRREGETVKGGTFE